MWLQYPQRRASFVLWFVKLELPSDLEPVARTRCGVHWGREQARARDKPQGRKRSVVPRGDAPPEMEG